MEFEIRHLFGCEAATLWAILGDPAYQRQANDRAGIDTELLEDRPAGPGQRLVRVRVVPRQTLPPAMARAVGTDRLTYVQEQRWRADTQLIQWSLHFDRLADRVRCRGQLAILPRAQGQCERLIRGELVVNVPLVGGMMEQKAIEGVRRSYDNTARVLEDWIRQREPGG